MTLAQVSKASGWHPAGRRDDCWASITTLVHNVRDLRSLLVSMAYAAQSDPASQIVSIVLRSRMSSVRIDREVSRFRALVSTAIGEAIAVYSWEDGHPVGAAQGPASLQHWLQSLVSQHLATPHKSSSRDAVLRLLFLLNLKDIGTTSTAEIRALTGASLPTVAGVLKELADHGAVTRQRRMLTLNKFPRLVWARWLARELDSRKVLRYVLESEVPGSPGTLLDRFRALRRSDIAVGGTVGAARHLPGTLSGHSQLELTVHGTAQADLSFVKDLDPELRVWRSGDGSPALTVSFLQRPRSFFELDETRALWADPVTCLLDLHAAGKTDFAETLLQHLINKKGVQQQFF